jgi:hypothetical protein
MASLQFIQQVLATPLQRCLRSLHMMGLTKVCNGLRFGIVTGSCNIMKPKHGMEITEALITLCGNNLQKNGCRAIMK